MRIPAFMLSQTVSVKPITGHSAYGDVFGTPYDLKCRIEPKRELIRDRDGEEVIAMARLFAFPEATLNHGDEITWAGNVYRVATVAPMPGPDGRTHHVEAWLKP